VFELLKGDVFIAIYVGQYVIIRRWAPKTRSTQGYRVRKEKADSIAITTERTNVPIIESYRYYQGVDRSKDSE
jgi:hypothetical protein